MDAQLQAIIIWLIVGGVAGWLAGQIVKGHGFGLVGNIVVGIVGAFLAGWLLPSLGLGLSGIVGAIVYAAIGAIILLFLIGLFKRAA
ncbi:MAG: GlsB/YeaQ/YmgE family stress response membrane protein [Dokdonella sp.]